jgi:hypothetical protein
MWDDSGAEGTKSTLDDFDVRDIIVEGTKRTKSIKEQ